MEGSQKNKVCILLAGYKSKNYVSISEKNVLKTIFFKELSYIVVKTNLEVRDLSSNSAPSLTTYITAQIIDT